MTTAQRGQMDKAGAEYWESGYQKMRPQAGVLGFDPRRGRTRDFWKSVFHEYFVFAFRGRLPAGARLVEVGAGGSAILPYFAREFGFQVVGVDYSPEGCRLAKEMLSREGVDGEVVCADVFEPPSSLISAADAVVSFGVVEHFTEPELCIKACAELLRPGGIMITTVPNMAGLVGRIQKALDPVVFRKHVELDAARLSEAHTKAGLEVLDVRYVLFAHFGVANINESVPGLGRVLRRAALSLLTAISGALWWFESRFGSPRSNRFTSPYVFCLARKPGAATTNSPGTHQDA